MGDTNYFGGVIKILETPKQRIVKKGTLTTTFRAQISQFRNTRIVRITFWGKLVSDVVSNYKINDYIIVEGYLSFRKKKVLNSTFSKFKQVEITVRKVYPFFLNSNRSLSTF